MTVLTGGPMLRPINEGFEDEHQAGLEAGLAGQEWAVPLDESGVFALYPSPGPQMAAWSRGWAKGRIRRSAADRQAREQAARTSRTSAQHQMAV